MALVYPLFDDEDSDLRRGWSLDKDGYPVVWQRNRARNVRHVVKACRIVAMRILGRPILPEEEVKHLGGRLDLRRMSLQILERGRSGEQASTAISRSRDGEPTRLVNGFRVHKNFSKHGPTGRYLWRLQHNGLIWTYYFDPDDPDEWDRAIEEFEELKAFLHLSNHELEWNDANI